MMDNIHPNNTIKSSQQSLWKTFLWLIIILFLPQLILSFFFGLYYEINHIENFSDTNFELWFKSTPIFLTLLLSPLLNFSLLLRATNSQNITHFLDACAIRSMKINQLSKYLSLGGCFWLSNLIIESTLELPMESFMLDVKAVMNDYTMILYITITLCFIVPIIEECIFRGWLFTKVSVSKYGKVGALIITSFTFTAIHTQYEHFISLIIVFLIGLTLGLVRYKSNNTSYCIAIHILLNTFTTVKLL